MLCSAGKLTGDKRVDVMPPPTEPPKNCPQRPDIQIIEPLPSVEAVKPKIMTWRVTIAVMNNKLLSPNFFSANALRAIELRAKSFYLCCNLEWKAAILHILVVSFVRSYCFSVLSPSSRHAQ